MSEVPLCEAGGGAGGEGYVLPHFLIEGPQPDILLITRSSSSSLLLSSLELSDTQVYEP